MTNKFENPFETAKLGIIFRIHEKALNVLSSLIPGTCNKVEKVAPIAIPKNEQEKINGNTNQIIIFM